MLHSPRSLAIEILLTATEELKPVDQIQDRLLQLFPLPDERDRHLLNSLVNGVFRQQGFLDHILSLFSKHPIHKMKQRTLQTLRVGLFQLFFLDRIPPSAAINETVKAIKNAGQPAWLSGFVNGVLRSISRNLTTLPHPDKADGQTLPLSARLSHPEWLTRRWINRYGAELTDKICQGNNTPPPMVLRVQSSAISRHDFMNLLEEENVKSKAGQETPNGVFLDEPRSPVTLPGFNKGFFTVQDQGAQIIPLLFETFPQGNYLDGCAGLGGKTASLTELIPPQAKLFALEPHDHRFGQLQENLSRLGSLQRVKLIHDTLESFALSTSKTFQGILLDVPCSGTGVIRRHPEIRWFRTKDDLHRYQKIQTGLLNAAAPLVEPAGILIYATCSTEPEENEDVIAAFLKQRPEFSVAGCKDIVPQSVRHCVSNYGFFRSIPNIDNMDGFFAARLVRSH